MPMKTVVRGGKKKRVLDCPDGKKSKGGKCVTMSASEKATRKKAGKKAAMKSKGKRAQAAKKRARSMKMR